MRLPCVTLCMLLVVAYPVTAQERAPIFDAHLHAHRATDFGTPPLALCTPQTEWPAWDPATPWGPVYMDMLKNPPCDDPVWSPETDEEVLKETLEVMERLNVFGVLSGVDLDLQAEWMRAAPGRFVPGIYVGGGSPPPDSLRGLIADGRIQVIGEVISQYYGLAPDDPSLEPYWQLAEEFDVPVGIHLGTGPIGVMYDYPWASNYRAALHSALTLEPVLVRHPSVRVYVTHAGWPMIDDMLALMWAHPQVYVDVGIISYWLPDFESYLKRIVEAGFGKRVMFGSDQMIWSEGLARAVQRIENMDFLTPAQKRDIFYNNAARFFRFTEEEIDRHHGR